MPVPVAICTNMPVERELLFCNGRAYNLTDTIAWIAEIKDRLPEGDFPQYRYEDVITTLVNLRYTILVDYDDFICAPYSDMLVPLDVFLRDHGVLDSTLANFVGDTATVGTFSVSSDGEFNDEDSISTQEEVELAARSVRNH